MELYSWDITLAGAHQLGINVKQMALPQTRSVISDVLNKQSAKLSVEKLINEMCENPDQYARNAVLIDAFGAGFFS